MKGDYSTIDSKIAIVVQNSSFKTFQFCIIQLAKQLCQSPNETPRKFTTESPEKVDFDQKWRAEHPFAGKYTQRIRPDFPLNLCISKQRTQKKD